MGLNNGDAGSRFSKAEREMVAKGASHFADAMLSLAQFARPIQRVSREILLKRQDDLQRALGLEKLAPEDVKTSWYPNVEPFNFDKGHNYHNYLEEEFQREGSYFSWLGSFIELPPYAIFICGLHCLAPGCGTEAKVSAAAVVYIWGKPRSEAVRQKLLPINGTITKPARTELAILMPVSWMEEASFEEQVERAVDAWIEIGRQFDGGLIKLIEQQGP